VIGQLLGVQARARGKAEGAGRYAAREKSGMSEGAAQRLSRELIEVDEEAPHLEHGVA